MLKTGNQNHVLIVGDHDNAMLKLAIDALSHMDNPPIIHTVEDPNEKTQEELLELLVAKQDRMGVLQCLTDADPQTTMLPTLEEIYGSNPKKFGENKKRGKRKNK